jgi:hypothetical protein
MQVRQSSSLVTRDSLRVLLYRATSSAITAVLDLLNSMIDLARRTPGMLACLSQGTGQYD